MNLHLVVLCFRQGCRLIQYVFRNRYLSDIVQQRPRLNREQFVFVVDPKTGRQLRAIRLDSPDVAMRVSIFRVDCARQCLDRLQIQLVKLADMLLSLFEFLNIETIQLVQNNSDRDA